MHKKQFSAVMNGPDPGKKNNKSRLGFVCTIYPTQIGRISCAILQANPKRLQRFFSSPGLGPLIRGENHASHLSCLLFCPKLVCSVTIKSRKDYQVLCLKSNVEK